MTGATSTHSSGVFGADPVYVRWFGDRIVSSLSGAAPARVLDIGCGDALLIRHLARLMPRSSFVGVDRSAGNIAAARAAIAQSTDRSRIEFMQHDYLTLDAGRFDLVVASSVLQGIDASIETLAARIASDTAAGGRLIHVTPYRCLYNTALNGVRKVLQRVRGAATDHMILTVARVLHPGQPHAKLRERVEYMYLVLRHYEDDVRAALILRGFDLITTHSVPHTSLGQPKHRLAVMSAPAPR